MTASIIDPVALEHRLTTIELGQSSGFAQLEALFKQQSSSLRQSIDTLTREVGKQNGRVKDLETWRGEKITETKVLASEQAGRSKLTRQIWNISSEVAKIAAGLGIVTVGARLLGV